MSRYLFLKPIQNFKPCCYSLIPWLIISYLRFMISMRKLYGLVDKMLCTCKYQMLQLHILFVYLFSVISTVKILECLWLFPSIEMHSVSHFAYLWSQKYSKYSANFYISLRVWSWIYSQHDMYFVQPTSEYRREIYMYLKRISIATILEYISLQLINLSYEKESNFW